MSPASRVQSQFLLCFLLSGSCAFSSSCLSSASHSLSSPPSLPGEPPGSQQGSPRPQDVVQGGFCLRGAGGMVLWHRVPTGIMVT